ncbi:hypothetical protein NDU88_005898 [Pleurodeles waltl]|uniref:Uncharacterized protein n=1 Tax=Pleurodeles waltl TaxID=8319 RepID=A0AAV7WCC9_PLEWA|nr:hypothetical protein NDU88_005898 [Pleurodeles waltl]
MQVVPVKSHVLVHTIEDVLRQPHKLQLQNGKAISTVDEEAGKPAFLGGRQPGRGQEVKKEEAQRRVMSMSRVGHDG